VDVGGAALDGVEDDGVDQLDESMVSVSSPSSSSPTSVRRKPSVASSSTRWVDSDFCSLSRMAAGEATFTFSGAPRSSSSSSSLSTSVGSPTTTAMCPFSRFSGRNW
jgi:hypothetical protein